MWFGVLASERKCLFLQALRPQEAMWGVAFRPFPRSVEYQGEKAMAFTRLNLASAAARIAAASFVVVRSGSSWRALPGGVVAPSAARRAGWAEVRRGPGAASLPG